MTRLLKGFFLTSLFLLFVVPSVFAATGTDGSSELVPESQNPLQPNDPEMGFSATDPPPNLKVTIGGHHYYLPPVADFEEDVLLKFSCSTQKWTMFDEYTPWDNVNILGFYTDIGTGDDTTYIFTGPRDYGDMTTTNLTDSIGLWMLNDINDNGVFDGTDSYLFSERDLTQNSGAQDHQWFLVYDVSAYKDSSATYFFNTFSEDVTISGSFDYLIYSDDDHTAANFDHNDMVVGVLCDNDPPVATCPGDTSFLVCDLTQVCLHGFSATDPDGNLQTVTVTGGTLSGDSVCFTPVVGVNTITLIATDSAGLADTCTTDVTVSLNQPPVVTGPANKNIFLCACNESKKVVLKPFAFSDPNNNIQSKTTNKGTLSGDSVYYYSNSCNTDTVIVTVTDSCGAVDKDTVLVTKTLNSAPVVTGPANKNIFLCACNEAKVVVLKPFAFSDPNSNIQTKTTNKGTLSGDSVYYTSNSCNPDTIIVTVTDSCGAVDKDTVIVTKTLNASPAVTGPSDKNIFLCACNEAKVVVLKPFGFSDSNGNIQSKT
ncbi:MAG: hypothetical protein L0Y74_01535, partial [candidate division Zixibacteria bacterium]|nr:hypothetical protein [candidate division Zixibacteria bacterium]